MRKIIEKIFTDLNQTIELENRQRLKAGTLTVPKSEVLILGQMSLMLNATAADVLNLTQTADVDAILRMDYFTKIKLLELLKANGLVYDEDSHLIWIPENATKIELFKYKNIEVHTIDAESILISKAVCAPHKNTQLIRQAIASGNFPTLADRIIENKGNVDFFLEESDE